MLGAIVGFALGVVLAHSRLLQRGFLPYIVASQTIPILAIAPMVVVWVNPKLPAGLQGWGSVAVIAAYLTFFPVAINTLRGLQSADPRALELMRSYAGEPLDDPLEAARADRRCRTSSPRSRSRRPRASSARSSASCPPGLQSGLGGAILNFNQYYSLEPQELWATNIVAALLGIAFFVVVVVAERLVVRRAPENIA